jgi:hypothetical protein
MRASAAGCVAPAAAVRAADVVTEMRNCRPLRTKRHSFLSFPYVCPEPVLVKRSLYIYINGSKRPFLLTGSFAVSHFCEKTVEVLW